MQDNFVMNNELKNILLSNEDIKFYFYIFLLHNIHKDNDKKALQKFLLEDYEAYKTLINKDNNLKMSLSETLNDIISNDLINDMVNDYITLSKNEGKRVIYGISQLLYLQNKYKDDEIGHFIDDKIKKWLEYITNYNQEEINKIVDLQNNEITTNEYHETMEALKQINARVFYQIIPSLNYEIHIKYNVPFMALCKDKNINEIKDYLLRYLNSAINDSVVYDRYVSLFNDLIDDIENNINVDLFTTKNIEKIKAIGKDYNIIIHDKKNYTIPKDTPEDTQRKFIKEMIKKYHKYLKSNKKLIQNNDDIKKWHNKADTFIKHLETYGKANLDLFTTDYMLDYLAYSTYQKNTYKLNLEDDIKIAKEKGNQKQIEKANSLLQATSKQLKAIDNARGGLVTYNETDTQTIKNQIKEIEESIKATSIKSDKIKLKNNLKDLKIKLVEAEEKEKALKEEYKNVCEYLKEIIKSMANVNKLSSYYKDLKKRKKDVEKRKKEIERIIQFNGWQLDLFGNGNYELIINKRKKEKLKLTIENLSKQVAKYTKEEQDIFDYLINKYLHNTDIKEIKFTLREYENVKGRTRADKQLISDIQAIRLLFREVWTYYTTDNKTYSFNEEHLFTKLNIKGELVTDTTDLNNANLDTQISLEPTETLQRLLQDHDNYLYISTPKEILQLNNDGEYLAKRLIKYLNYLARVNKTSEVKVSLDAIIEELQHYGLKHFNMLDRHKTYKTEIVDVIDKTLNILEGENHLNKRFIEVLDRQPFIDYDNEYRGKSQKTSINNWGKNKITIKVFNLDDNKLLDTKNKHKKKKHKATNK